MSKKSNLYLGKAGQFALMSEFLCRGCNVATPEVDVGDDIFVVRDIDGDITRVQVKTATGITHKSGVHAKFYLRRNQLVSEMTPELNYVFLVRLHQKWLYYALIPQIDLYEYVQSFEKEKRIIGASITLNFVFNNNKLSCKNEDFSSYLSNFGKFELIRH